MRLKSVARAISVVWQLGKDPVWHLDRNAAGAFPLFFAGSALQSVHCDCGLKEQRRQISINDLESGGRNL
jgi:hypothetical protein